MRSVIDEIATAEQRAEEIRLSAAAGARETIVKARDDAQSALAQLEETERETTRKQLEIAKLEGERLSKEQLEQMKQEADELCARAQERVGDAVRYLVDKVLKTA